MKNAALFFALFILNALHAAAQAPDAIVLNNNSVADFSAGLVTLIRWSFTAFALAAIVCWALFAAHLKLMCRQHGKMATTAFFALCCIFLGNPDSVSAQKTATWKGGTPGRGSDWNCPKNWKEGRVPNEFSHVIIPDVSSSTFSYPVIESGEVEILSLVCAPTTYVRVRNEARLFVQEPSPYGELQYDPSARQTRSLAVDAGSERYFFGYRD